MGTTMAIPPFKASEAYAQSQGSPFPLAAPLAQRFAFAHLKIR
jgi:hypothetical protein